MVRPRGVASLGDRLHGRRRGGGALGTVPAEKSRIARFGEKDNFWSMGDTGPCGPCSELHYDQGPSVPGDAVPNGRGDRVMEIWNLVFMAVRPGRHGTDDAAAEAVGRHGRRLERITAILQRKNNNYDTDLFAPIIRSIENVSGREYVAGWPWKMPPSASSPITRGRATMLIADGVIPSNEGRGYVLRRIIRRALRYGRRLGIELKGGFLAQACGTGSLHIRRNSLPLGRRDRGSSAVCRRGPRKRRSSLRKDHVRRRRQGGRGDLGRTAEGGGDR